VPPRDGALWCGDRKCGGYTFTVYGEDWKEPGVGADKFWIEVKDPSGNVVALNRVSLPRPASGSNLKTIEGGNIQIPHQ
jgi:hypothetical protein